MSATPLSQAATLCLDEATHLVHAKQALRTVLARDVDEHAQHLTAWEQRYDQIAPGRFEGVLEEWQSQGLQIFREGTSRAIRQSCRVWSDAFWFGIEAQATGMRINGRQVGAGMVMTRPGDCEFELVTPDDHEIFGVVVQRDALMQAAARLGCEVDWQRLAAAELLHADPQALKDCQDNIASLLQLGARTRLPGAAMQLRQEAVLVSLLALLDAGDIEAEAGASLRRRRRIVSAACGYALAQQEQAVTVPMLCEAVHVSRRTLQYCFEDVLGMSPMAYLRTMRLNGVRRALLASEGQAAIGEVAADWGFANFSQFSCDYKKLFGQTPSAALLAMRTRLAG